jgi:hypothetical protein
MTSRRISIRLEAVSFDKTDKPVTLPPGRGSTASANTIGIVDVEQKLWVGVDIAPPGDDLAMQLGNAVHDRHLLSPRTTPPA